MNALPCARTGDLHVWVAALDRAADPLTGLLSPDERLRALRIVDCARRARWARARGFLRLLLAAYLEEDPRALSFYIAPHGKLVLAPSPSARWSYANRGAARARARARERERLYFNVSHSAGVAVYAFSRACDVGVDVEVPRPRPHLNELALAARAFGEEGMRSLASAPPDARAREFRRAWVAHEAQLKLRGASLLANAAAARAPARARGDRHGPWIGELDLGAGVLAAVAADTEPRELHVRRASASPPERLSFHQAPFTSDVAEQHVCFARP